LRNIVLLRNTSSTALISSSTVGPSYCPIVIAGIIFWVPDGSFSTFKIIPRVTTLSIIDTPIEFLAIATHVKETFL
jgi:hypothetical protein